MAKDTVIVVINITSIRSDAFIISSQGLRVEPLPGLDEEDLSDRTLCIQKGLSGLSDSNISSDPFKQMVETLRILWEKLVFPVLKVIGKKSIRRLDDTEPWPHVCWIPTGVLSMYPIHAAGPYKLTRLHDAGAMSRVVSSYAPSLRIVSLNKSDMPIPTSDPATPVSPTVAVIAEAQPPNGDGMEFGLLKGARRGIEIIQQTFPIPPAGSGEADNLIPESPNKSTALGLISRGIPLVQFFCHGIVDYDEPINSTLLLKDWQTDLLTARSIMDLDIRGYGCRLAFLSACWGAHGGVEKLQDEISHVACALQVAGFPCVIGSLWEAVEDDMVELMDVFYSTLNKRFAEGGRNLFSPRETSETLHHAVMRIRERTCKNNALSNPLRWAPFLFYGL